ncbi:hypothetical protein RF11_14497 [Thelohanellus kitauei]|uniref:Uncharacterized protein n=1 Tax=Thelohanellus kitauei TaxID=669202 RepID=A0A0C2JYY6_THEKT|nr:hypothetical protein RF11_14497 [Thelohanellus kitauei]
MESNSVKVKEKHDSNEEIMIKKSVDFENFVTKMPEYKHEIVTIQHGSIDEIMTVKPGDPLEPVSDKSDFKEKDVNDKPDYKHKYVTEKIKYKVNRNWNFLPAVIIILVVTLFGYHS